MTPRQSATDGLSATKRPKQGQGSPGELSTREHHYTNATALSPSELAHIAFTGPTGRRLTHPRADWITHPEWFGVPPFVTEHRFHPTRRWRFDYAWPGLHLALEIDGGSGGYGRHSRPGGMRGDHEKLNAAAALGWRILRVLAGEEIRLTTVLAIRACIDPEHRHAA